MCWPSQPDNKAALNQVYNTAVGDRTTLVELVNYLTKLTLAEFDENQLANQFEVKHGPNRKGDIPTLAGVS